MVPFGIGTVWLGYSVLYFGLTMIRGSSAGFLDLVIPGRYSSAGTTKKGAGKVALTAGKGLAAGAAVGAKKAAK